MSVKITYLTHSFFAFRHLLNDMSKKVLSERFINRRAKICQINIKVNFISWVVEFLGCMTMALNFLVIGTKNNELAGFVKTITMLVFFVILPCTFLVNSSAGINTIVDDSWFNAMSRLINPVQELEDGKPSKDTEKRITANEEHSKIQRTSVYTISNYVEPQPPVKNQREKNAKIYQRAASMQKTKIAWE